MKQDNLVFDFPQRRSVVDWTLVMTKIITTATASFAILLSSAVYLAHAERRAQAMQTTAQRDFTKLSAQGRIAMQDVDLARADIFNGQINMARSAINAASSALDKAKSDNTAFLKAESDMVAPASVNQPRSNTVATQWLPVASSMAVDEDYKASPQRSAAVTKANGQLAKGDKKGALETLKMTGVDVSFTQALAPLNATVTDVGMAQRDMTLGEYYEANQELKAAQDGIRFDTVTVVGKPKVAHS